MTPEYLRSIEARLRMQDELLQQVFVALWQGEREEFEAFVNKTVAGLYAVPQPTANVDESMELRLAIKMQWDRFAAAVRSRL